MTIEEMIRRKKERKLTYEQLAERSGVPASTIQKIFSGATPSPRFFTLRALEEALITEEDLMHRDLSFLNDEKSDLLILRDSAPSYMPEAKKLTVDDRDMLPEERRTELIDGVLYDMAAPKAVHQVISMKIGYQLESLIQKKGSHCIVFTAPTDVRLDKDKYTVVQPDIFLICDRSQIKEIIWGAPELVMEILSPSTRMKDQLLKLYKYAAAGVREYWIIDPENRNVMVYQLELLTDDHSNLLSIGQLYNFTDQIPLMISNGECQINMQEINDLLNELGI